MTQITRKIVIDNPQYLAGKPVASLVKLAKSFSGDILASVDSNTVSSKSLGKFLSLSPDVGQTIILSADQSANDILDKMVDILIINEVGTLSLSKSISDSQDINPTHILQKQVILLMPDGMHARPAAQLVGLAKHFDGQLEISTDGERFVKAKSLSKLMSLGAKYGKALFVKATPNESLSSEDAKKYFDKVINEIENGLGDDIVPLSASLDNDKELNNKDTGTETIQTISWSDFGTPIADVQDDNNLVGLPATSGMAIAPAFIKTIPNFSYEKNSTLTVTAEIKKLNDAIKQAQDDIKAVIETTDVDDVQNIFKSHLEILEDPAIIKDVEDILNKKGLTAECAWHQVMEKTAQGQERLTDKNLARRAADFRDVNKRILATLCGLKTTKQPTEQYILVMNEVSTSDVASIDKKLVAGILTAVGGTSDHSAMIARALGIPLIVGAGLQILEIKTNTTLIINGANGYYTIAPNEEQIIDAQKAIQFQQELKIEAEKYSQNTAETLDDHRVEVVANIGNAEDTAKAIKDGAEGIGLFRTEFVFMEHSAAPDESTQTAIYTKAFENLDGRPLVVRTLDVGGDKPLPYLDIPHEDNPFLGMRGIRLSLRKPELLREQVTALLKAAANKHPLRIMFPMVGRMEEWKFAKNIVNEVLKKYPCDHLQLGIMIEVPSAALISHTFAKEVDFFSIGTNDLTQYTMAIDRSHPVLSADASGLHPSVLSLIDLTVHNAHKHGKWVGICGDIASDPDAIPVLVGLGIDELSMPATNIAITKAQIRKLNYSDCKSIAKKALVAESAKQVRALVQSEIINK